MASLDTALNRLAIALDALDARLLAAAPSKAGDRIAHLTEEKSAMQEEIERLRGEVRALDDLHEDMSARLDAALREVQLVVSA